MCRVSTATYDRDEKAAGGVVTAYRFRVLLGAELALAATVGALFLGHASLWLDEGTSVRLVELDWGGLFDVIRSTEAMHGLYYMILKLWIPLAGTSEFALRVPSVVFFLGGVLALVFVGRALFTDRIALIAGLLLTVNPFMLVYAREARGYAMVTMLVTVSTLLFVRMMLAPRIVPRLLVLYTVVSILSVYAHAWSLFVLVVHAATVIAVGRFHQKLQRMLGSWVAMAVAISPLLYFFAASSGEQVSWIRPVGLGGFVLHFRALAGGWVLMVLYLVAAIAALGAYGLGKQRRGERTWAVGMLAAWIMAPPILTFLLSLWVPLFLSRYLIVSLPGLILLVAVGIDAIKPRSIGHGMLGVIVILSAVSSIPSYTSSYEDWRSATDFVLAAAGPGDVVVLYAPYVRLPYEYYEQRSGSTAPPEVIRYDLDAGEQPSSAAGSLVTAVNKREDRQVWVVISHDVTGNAPAIERELTANRRLESRTEFEGNIRILQLLPVER